MKIEIKSRWNGSILFSIRQKWLSMTLHGQHMVSTFKRRFRILILRLRRFSTSGIHIRRLLRLHPIKVRWPRTLTMESFQSFQADLGGADLRSAKGLNKFAVCQLLFLLDQPGKIRAYKLVKADGLAPFNGGITYEVGKLYEVADADTNEETECAKGINLATLDWCIKEMRDGYRILIAEFEAKDIAAIPTASDGKFRVFRCSIVGEKNLKEIGL